MVIQGCSFARHDTGFEHCSPDSPVWDTSQASGRFRSQTWRCLKSTSATRCGPLKSELADCHCLINTNKHKINPQKWGCYGLLYYNRKKHLRLAKCLVVGTCFLLLCKRHWRSKSFQTRQKIQWVFSFWVLGVDFLFFSPVDSKIGFCNTGGFYPPCN